MKNLPLDTAGNVEDYFLTPDIHVTQLEQSGGWLTFVASLVACALECLLVYMVADDHISAAAGAFFYAIIILALASYARAMQDRGGENRFAILLLLSAAVAGPFGAAGTALTILLHALFARHSLPFQEWYDTMFPHTPQTRSQRIYSDIRAGRDDSEKTYNVIPFLDVLSFGNEVQKRQALSKMTSNFHPHFAPAFRKALSDPSNMIRVQAATAITKIENQFLMRAMKLTALMETHGDDPVVILALAKHYDDHAYTGLLDAEREQLNRRKALQFYQDYLRLRPNDTQAYTSVARILMRNGDYAQACDWCRQCMAQGHASDAIVVWYSEALFACGRYDELRRYRALPASATPQTLPAQRFEAALSLWAGAKS